VWYVVWDDRRSAEGFVQRYAGKLRVTARKGYRATLEALELEGKPGLRYVLAPAGWAGWGELPKPSLTK
jgi:hypothetical protein